MSSILKSEIKKELKAVGFKETDMNDKLATAIAKGVQNYLNANVVAPATGGKLSAS